MQCKNDAGEVTSTHTFVGPVSRADQGLLAEAELRPWRSPA
jgi:hypothetical protein